MQYLIQTLPSVGVLHLFSDIRFMRHHLINCYDFESMLMFNLVYLLRLLIYLHIHLFIKFLMIKIIGRFLNNSPAPPKRIAQDCLIILAAFVLTSFTSLRSMNIFEKGVEVSGLLILAFIESKMLESQQN